jgi:hypothetical protein
MFGMAPFSARGLSFTGNDPFRWRGRARGPQAITVVMGVRGNRYAPVRASISQALVTVTAPTSSRASRLFEATTLAPITAGIIISPNSPARSASLGVTSAAAAVAGGVVALDAFGPVMTPMPAASPMAAQAQGDP